MAFNISYLIQAQDKFSAVSDKIARSAGNMRKQMQEAANAAEKLGKNQQTMGQRASIVRGKIFNLKNAIVGLGAIMPIKMAADFEQGLINVGKTTGMSREELELLGKEFDKMSTRMPVSTNSMLEFAETAGSMGITGVANLKAFTEVMAQLQETSDILGQEGAMRLGEFINVSGETPENVRKIANAITRLGNDFNATEGKILDYSVEVASATNAFNLGAPAALAYGTVLGSMGQRAMGGATAVGRTYRIINEAVLKNGKNLANFAKVSGMSAENFKKLWATDKNEAVLKFFEGLKKTGEKAPLVLDALGLSGDELAKVLPVLANNADQLRLAMEKGNKEYETGNALNEEYAAFLQSFNSKFGIFLNKIKLLVKTIGNQLLPVVGAVFAKMSEWLQVIIDWTQRHPTLTKAIVLTAAALATLGVAVWLVKSAIWVLGGNIGIAIARFTLLKTVTIAFTVVMKAVAAVAAMAGVSMTVAFGIVVVAIAALAAAGWWLYNNWNKIKLKLTLLMLQACTFFENLAETVKGYFYSALNSVIEFVNRIIRTINEVGTKLDLISENEKYKEFELYTDSTHNVVENQNITTKNQSSAKIDVDFTNLPKGTNVKSQTSGSNVQVNTGQNMNYTPIPAY